MTNNRPIQPGIHLPKYGIESSTFHAASGYPVDPDYSRFAIVKTHLFSKQLLLADPSGPASD